MKHYYQHLTQISERSTTTTLLHLLVVIVVWGNCWNVWNHSYNNYLLIRNYIKWLYERSDFEKVLTSNSLSWLLTELLSLGLTFLYNDKYFDICHQSGLAIIWIIKGCVRLSVRKSRPSCHAISVPALVQSEGKSHNYLIHLFPNILKEDPR